jgi:hypothetical protein
VLVVVTAVLSLAAAAIATAMAAATTAAPAIALALKPPALFSAPAVTPVAVPLPVFAAWDCAKANEGAAAKAIAKLHAVINFLPTMVDDLQNYTHMTS